MADVKALKKKTNRSESGGNEGIIIINNIVFTKDTLLPSSNLAQNPWQPVNPGTTFAISFMASSLALALAASFAAPTVAAVAASLASSLANPQFETAALVSSSISYTQLKLY